MFISRKQKICYITAIVIFSWCHSIHSNENEFSDLNTTNPDTKSSEIYLECKKISLEEMSLIVNEKEIGIAEKVKLEGVVNQILTFKVKGSPIGRTYTFFIDKLNTTERVGKFVVSKTEELIFSDGNKHFLIIGNDFMKGEPIVLRLIASDDQSKVEFKIRPFPIKEFWSDGASIEIIIAHQNFELFNIDGKGFMPQEELIISSQSCNEFLTPYVTNCNNNGLFVGVLSPAVIGETGGVGKFIITRKKTNETKILNFFWGDKAK